MFLVVETVLQIIFWYGVKLCYRVFKVLHVFQIYSTPEFSLRKHKKVIPELNGQVKIEG